MAKKSGKTRRLLHATGVTQISISLSDSLVSKIDQMADAQNRNRSNFIATVMEELVATRLSK